jgi:hypothetical protein
MSAFESTVHNVVAASEPNVDGLSNRTPIRIVESMNAHQTLAFSHLLSAWTRREEARDQRDLASLASARQDLEIARAEMRIATLGR